MQRPPQYLNTAPPSTHHHHATSHHHHHRAPAGASSTSAPPSFKDTPGSASASGSGSGSGMNDYMSFGAASAGPAIGSYYSVYSNAQERERAQQIAQAQQQQQQLQSQPQPQSQPAPVLAPRVPLVERDIYMLSLPSQDLPSYYDPPSDDSPANSPPNSPPPVSNRGNKLHPSGPFIRRGRLGAYPHTDAGFEPHTTKRQRLLQGTLPQSAGFAVAPNLHLLRAEYADENPEPFLPPPPATPLDLLKAHQVQKTLGPKNKVFRTLGMSATGLIEQEGPLITSLARVCAGLRGEGFEWRWEGDEERRKEREREREQEDRRRAEEDLEKQHAREERAEAQAQAQAQTDAQEAQDKGKQKEEAPMAVDDDDADATLPTSTVETPIPETSTVTPAEKDEPINDQSDPLPEPSSSLATPVPLGPLDAGTNTDADSSAIKTPLLNGVEDLPTTAAVEGSGETVADAVQADVDMPLDGEADPEREPDNDNEENDEDSPDEPLRRRSGRVASRVHEPRTGRSTSVSSTSSRSSSASAPLAHTHKRSRDADEEEEMPEYAKRLVDPEVYVRSLFVSRETIELAFPVAGAPGQPPQMGLDLFSPNEQEVMVHDCLTDLHRFLADSMEYRARLAEIRDGILGVERRRKGMWKVVRTLVESEWIDDEE